MKSRKLCPKWRDKINPQKTTKWSGDRQLSRKIIQNKDSEDDSRSWKNDGGEDWEDARKVFQRPRRTKEQAEMNNKLEGIHRRITEAEAQINDLEDIAGNHCHRTEYRKEWKETRTA